MAVNVFNQFERYIPFQISGFRWVNLHHYTEVRLHAGRDPYASELQRLSKRALSSAAPRCLGVSSATASTGAAETEQVLQLAEPQKVADPQLTAKKIARPSRRPPRARSLMPPAAPKGLQYLHAPR